MYVIVINIYIVKLLRSSMDKSSKNKKNLFNI